MKLTKKQLVSKAIKFEIKDGKKQLARAFLYLIKNDLHKEPYGLMEDVFVDASLRGQGIGTKLVKAVIAEAKERKCYKLIGTSRHSNIGAHKLYGKLGLKEHGVEFRLDL